MVNGAKAGMTQVDEIFGKPIWHNEIFEKYVIFIPTHPLRNESRMWWFDSLEELKQYVRENAPLGCRAKEM